MLVRANCSISGNGEEIVLLDYQGFVWPLYLSVPRAKILVYEEKSLCFLVQEPEDKVGIWSCFVSVQVLSQVSEHLFMPWWHQDDVNSPHPELQGSVGRSQDHLERFGLKSQLCHFLVMRL